MKTLWFCNWKNTHVSKQIWFRIIVWKLYHILTKTISILWFWYTKFLIHLISEQTGVSYHWLRLNSRPEKRKGNGKTENDIGTLSRQKTGRKFKTFTKEDSLINRDIKNNHIKNYLRIQKVVTGKIFKKIDEHLHPRRFKLRSIWTQMPQPTPVS